MDTNDKEHLNIAAKAAEVQSLRHLAGDVASKAWDSGYDAGKRAMLDFYKEGVDDAFARGLQYGADAMLAMVTGKKPK